MKPALFEYLSPRSVSEAIDLLHHRAGEARVLAGGQSLVPLLSFRLAKPAALVDINGVSQLAYIRQTDDTLAIGAMTRQQQVLESTDVSRVCPLLSDAVSFVGHPAIRNRGTIGGSLAHADPTAELAIVMSVLEAEPVLLSSRGERTVKADEFFLTYLTTSLAPDELLVEARFPFLGSRTGWSFLEVSRRHGDFAVVAAAALVTLDEQNRCHTVRVALGGVGPTPIRARALEQAMSNAEATQAATAEAAQMVKEQIEPETDIHATAEYGSDVAVVLARRALDSAIGLAMTR